MRFSWNCACIITILLTYLQELYTAGEKKLGTDESKFNQILCSYSFPQIQLVVEEYRNVSSKSLEQAIKSEMSGDLEQGMLAIGEFHKA